MNKSIITKKQLLTLDQCKAQYLKAKKAYYNSKPIMTDAAFDTLEDHIKKNDPKWAELAKTGTTVKNKKTEAPLFHPMPSLNKQYGDAMPKWLAKFPADGYIAMDKLDGSALQLRYENGKPTHLITRGDGTLGGDISFLLPHLNLPAKIKHKGVLVFRCEALMKRKTFTAKWADKFDNGRNMVNGLLNRREPHPALKDVDIVILGCYGMLLSAGLDLADGFGFQTVPRRFTPAKLSTAALEGYLTNRRKVGHYEIDGLVVAPLDFTLDYKSSDKPKNITAYKVNDEGNAAEVKVKRIIWQVTGRGRIVPKIEIEPTEMDGVMVKHAAAHNAEWMLERKIGPGAIVKVLRSGGVIPKIVAVTKPGKFQAPDIEYKQSGVHFVVAQATSATQARVDVLNVVKFMKTLGIELIAGKTAEQLYKAGLKSPLDYIGAYGAKKLGMTIHEAGIGGKQGANIYDEIKRVFSAPIQMKKLMVASQVFGVGIGERKLTQIEDAGISMDKLHNYKGFPKQTLLEVPGFSEKTVQVLADGWRDWLKFYDRCYRVLTTDGSLPRKKKSVGGKLSGVIVSFTGYRDKEQEAWVAANGGEVVSFGSKTSILLYKAGGKESTKVSKAEEKGIKVMTFQQLEKQK